MLCVCVCDDCITDIQLTSDEYLASKVAAISAQQQHQASGGGGRFTTSSPNSGAHTTALTVCRDFQSGKCVRPYCRFVHVQKGTSWSTSTPFPVHLQLQPRYLSLSSRARIFPSFSSTFALGFLLLPLAGCNLPGRTLRWKLCAPSNRKTLCAAS